MKKGFTLVELIAVIIILGIIMILVMPGVSNVLDNSKKNSLSLSANKVASKAIEKTTTDDMLNDTATFVKKYSVSDLGIDTDNNYDGYVIVSKCSGEVKAYIYLWDEKKNYEIMGDLYNENEYEIKEYNSADYNAINNLEINSSNECSTILPVINERVESINADDLDIVVPKRQTTTVIRDFRIIIDAIPSVTQISATTSCSNGSSLSNGNCIKYEANSSVCGSTPYQCNGYQCNPYQCNPTQCNPYQCNGHSQSYSCTKTKNFTFTGTTSGSDPCSQYCYGKSNCTCSCKQVTCDATGNCTLSCSGSYTYTDTCSRTVYDTCYDTCYSTCYNTCYSTCYSANSCDVTHNEYRVYNCPANTNTETYQLSGQNCIKTTYTCPTGYNDIDENHQCSIKTN